MFCKGAVQRNLTKFIGKHLCQNLCFNEDAEVQLATLQSERLCYKCFTVNFAKFLKTLFTEQLQQTVSVIGHAPLFTPDQEDRTTRPKVFYKKGVLKIS